jgi:hypothetical protein
MIRRWLTRGLVILALIGAGLVATQAPAAAAWNNCPAGTSCVWSGENGAGVMTVLAWSKYGGKGCKDFRDFVNPVGGYHSAKGGYGNGHELLIWDNYSCSGLPMAYLAAGQTFNVPFTAIITFRAQ